MVKKHKKSKKQTKKPRRILHKYDSQKEAEKAKGLILSMKQPKRASKPKNIKAEKTPDYTSGRALKIPVVGVLSPCGQKTLISKEAYLREKDEKNGLNYWREFNSTEVI